MALHPLQEFIRRLRRARSVAEGGHLTDVQLLERFIRQRDEAAFEVLVWRHGTLVLNVARRLLRHAADTEDVFQATFLTLARKASAIRRGTSLSSWLYKVAYRLALRVRQVASRRERQMQFGLDTVESPEEQSDAELRTLLAEEVNRLPERYRAVVVLCYLQGATTEEAARVLGCPRGTVLSRLSSARQRLRRRLVRRGIAPAVAVTAAVFGETATATPSVALVACVVRAALPFAAGGAAVPMVSSQAAMLAQGALQMMLWNKIKIVALMVCMIALAGTGSGWLARSRSQTESSPQAAKAPLLKIAPPAPAGKQVDNPKQEIDHIQKELATLLEKEKFAEMSMRDAIIEARLQLLERQDELKWQEEMLELERERIRRKLKDKQSQIAHLNEYINNIAAKFPKEQEPPSLASTKKQKMALEDQLKQLEGEEERAMNRARQEKRHLRRIVIEAEVKLENIKNRQSRQREDFATQRERVQRRLQRLEDKDLDLQPPDRLRDVERNLNALRREVGELRRALERQKDDLRKRPE